MRFARLNLFWAFCCCVVFSGITSCKKKDEQATGCPEQIDLVSQFVDDAGNTVHIYANGEAYLVTSELCSLAGIYFDPQYIGNNYLITDSVVYIRTDDGSLFPTRNNFIETFETASSFIDLFATSVADTGKFWTSFVLQSPLAPTVSEYVALRTCILNGTCDFRDNRMDIVAYPENASNRVLKCTAVAPTASMVTSKCSFESALPFFPQGSDLWFEARYNVRTNRPFSLVDFENNFFEQSPGPRLVFRNNCLAIENKFNEKLNYLQDNPVEFPVQTWVTVKVHLNFSASANGVIQVWQNGQLILDKTGVNLPLPNSIQNSLEIGISATSQDAVVLVDDIRISDSPF